MPTEEQNPLVLHRATQAVRTIEHTEDVDSQLATVTTASQTLSDMGITLPAAVSSVTLIIDPLGKDVHYNPSGTATTANGAIFKGAAFPIFGNKAKLDIAEFIVAAATGNMSVFVHANLADDI